MVYPVAAVEPEGSFGDFPSGFWTGKELDPDFVAINSRNYRYHFPARFYLPNRGVFGQVDALIQLAHVVTSDRYQYVASRPTILSDPLGLQEAGDQKRCDCELCVFISKVKDPRGRGETHASIQLLDCDNVLHDINGLSSGKASWTGKSEFLVVTIRPGTGPMPPGGDECKTVSCKACECVISKSKELNNRKLGYGAWTAIGGFNSNSAAYWILHECNTGLGKNIGSGKTALVERDALLKAWDDYNKKDPHAWSWMGSPGGFMGP